jgi:hypothetical protein
MLMDLDNFLYEAIDASRLIDVKSWGPYFDEIPVDPYIRDGYRYKSIGWFRVKRDSAAAMEGFHQDGNRHVAMLVVGRNNITDDSGVSQYVLDDHGIKTDTLIFDSVISAGQLIFWNDKRVWHYGTELKVADNSVNGGRGTRDIIILSAKTPPANMPMGPVPEVFRS